MVSVSALVFGARGVAALPSHGEQEQDEPKYHKDVDSERLPRDKGLVAELLYDLWIQGKARGAGETTRLPCAAKEAQAGP